MRDVIFIAHMSAKDQSTHSLGHWHLVGQMWASPFNGTVMLAPLSIGFTSLILAGARDYLSSKHELEPVTR